MGDESKTPVRDSLDDQLRELYNLRVPASFQENWQNAVAREESEGMNTRKNRKHSWLRMVLPAAAALVLVVGAVWVGGQSPEGAQPSTVSYSASTGVARSSKSAGSGNSAPALYAAAPNGAESAMLAEDSYSMDADAAAVESDAQSVTPQAADNRKLVRTADLTIRTDAYDDDLNAVNALIVKVGGYTESVYADGNQSAGSTRSTALTVRVPSDALDDFLSGLEGVGRIISRSESVEDKTLQYADNQARLKTLREKMNRLNELLGKAENVTDIIEIESTIADTQYAIDRFETTQRTIDRDVDMSKVYISLQEDSPVAVTSEMSLGERIGAAFSASVEGLGRFLRNMLVFLVMALPVAGVLAVLVAAVIVIRKSVQKHKDHQNEKPEEKP